MTHVQCNDPACCLPSRSVSNSVTFLQPLICYPAFHFLLPLFTSAPPVFGPSCPRQQQQWGELGGSTPPFTLGCASQLCCERPTHTEFRYIEAHSSRCHWCFCGKLAMSPLYSGFPLINQPSGKPSFSASTSLVPSLPRTVG